MVDNASRTPRSNLLPARFPWVRLIRSATQPGLSPRATILAMLPAVGAIVYFLNPDTELVGSTRATRDSLWTLYARSWMMPSVGWSGRNCAMPTTCCKAAAAAFPRR